MLVQIVGDFHVRPLAMDLPAHLEDGQMSDEDKGVNPSALSLEETIL